MPQLDEDAAGVPRGHCAESPLSVSQLNWLVKQTLEQAIPQVWLEAEISDLSRPSSGHLYFTLKDEQSQVRGVMWRNTAARLPFKLKDGMSVICQGAVEVYAPRGSYQLIVNRMQPQGIGALQLAFQQLHQKLAKEGLFAAGAAPLPRFPRRLGFVTSPSGAAVHDFLEAARSRWPDFELVLIPARVQGEGAAAEIVQGIKLAQRILPELDLLIVGRGGGSIEDLWCFNEEPVIRALAACRIPTISAVGHEIDVTLSDLAADVRALTPTHAAQLALPSESELRGTLQQLERRASGAVQGRLKSIRQRLETFATRSVLARPHQIHQQRRQVIDEFDLRARAAIWNAFKAKRQRLESLARACQALSPLEVLARGYSLTHLSGSQQPLISANQAAEGDEVVTILAEGELLCQVVRKKSG
ncbi:MAG: exodeoxyribonuclease VII large subunit [Pirellulaceae bacterium]